MTFARYSRDLWAEQPAKVAKPAKAQEDQEVGVAKPWLMTAKVERSPPNLSHALAKLSPAKSAEYLDFSRFSCFSRPAHAQSSADHCPASVEVWKEGFEKLLAMTPPETFPAHAWSSLIDDADRFLARWADQAARLGWESWEVWGVHRHAPWRRIGAMGLVPSLQGRKLIALLSDAAVIETRTGNRLRHYRRSGDALGSAKRALIWELE